MNNYPFYNNNFFDVENYLNILDNNNPLYDPKEGYLKGNIFKNLYEPFREKKNYEILPINKQAELLTNINILCFYLNDLDLYLDIHSNDSNMITLYNKYLIKKNNLINEYESKYGPLSLDSKSLNFAPWNWINIPWPWDN